MIYIPAHLIYKKLNDMSNKSSPFWGVSFHWKKSNELFSILKVIEIIFPREHDAYEWTTARCEAVFSEGENRNFNRAQG